MWIVFRLALALSGFFARLLRGMFAPQRSGRLADGTPLYSKQRKLKDGSIQLLRVGVPLRAPMLLRLQRETGSDRWFKSIGLATEFQTGSARFDQDVFIASDNPQVLGHLADSAEARTAITNVLLSGYKRIELDGSVLWLHPGTRGQSRNEATLLLALRDSLRGIETTSRFVLDPYALRIALVEAGVWSVFGYALAAWFENRVHGAAVHMEPFDLLWPGLAIAGLMLLVLLAIVATVLRGSSFAHKVLLESGVLLLIAAPVAGWQLASDLNRGMDTAPAVTEERVIEDRATVRRRKSATRYRVTLRSAMASQIPVPTRIDVEHDVYQRATKGRILRITIGRGWLGAPWYRRMDVLDAPAGS